MAILGSSFGAKAINIEWSVSWVRIPLIRVKFSIVPVLPQTSIPGICAIRAVPIFTTFAMPSTTGLKCSSEMVVYRLVRYLGSIKVPCIPFTKWGV